MRRHFCTMVKFINTVYVGLVKYEYQRGFFFHLATQRIRAGISFRRGSFVLYGFKWSCKRNTASDDR